MHVQRDELALDERAKAAAGTCMDRLPASCSVKDRDT